MATLKANGPALLILERVIEGKDMKPEENTSGIIWEKTTLAVHANGKVLEKWDYHVPDGLSGAIRKEHVAWKVRSKIDKTKLNDLAKIEQYFAKQGFKKV